MVRQAHHATELPPLADSIASPRTADNRRGPQAPTSGRLLRQAQDADQPKLAQGTLSLSKGRPSQPNWP
jgi:hypothetical protein